MSTASLLIELLTEELPPLALAKLSESFATGLSSKLKNYGLLTATSVITPFATPRRLAVLCTNVLDRAPDYQERKKLMPTSIAYDTDGKPTPALLKRLDKEQIALEPFPHELLTQTIENGTSVVYLERMVSGARLNEALQVALSQTISELPIPKVMSYQLADGETTVHFARPAHNLIALWGNQVLPITALGLTANRTLIGHRFQSAASTQLPEADDYAAWLEKEGKVLPGFKQRRSAIYQQLLEKAQPLQASLGAAADYEPLLDEVTALVEYPTVYVGQFEAEFLQVPQECLILTMRLHQKYFPLFAPNGTLMPYFLIVSNMDLADPHHIIEGNQRVIRPRLSDARFFFETDQKTPLLERLSALEKITYHQKLGSQKDRVLRLQNLSEAIAKQMVAASVSGASAEIVNQSGRAALLAKADLTTAMVGEFPELQGIMGRYYALHDGEAALVADACAEHYRPRFAGDALPQALPAMALALADKLDALVGIWGIGLIPTGDKDPFALRRAALGVLRILSEKNLPFSLLDLLTESYQTFPSGQLTVDTPQQVLAFMLDRLRIYLKEPQESPVGTTSDYQSAEIEAVLAVNPHRIDLVLSRLQALRSFRNEPAFAALAGAHKRIHNILRKASETEPLVSAHVTLQPEQLIEPAEKALYSALQTTAPKIIEATEHQQYAVALTSLASLRPVVDQFFDTILVMAEDPKVRANRLVLLTQLNQTMNSVADLAKLSS